MVIKKKPAQGIAYRLRNNKVMSNSSSDEVKNIKQVNGKESEVEEDAWTRQMGKDGVAEEMLKLRAEYPAGDGHARGRLSCPASVWKAQAQVLILLLLTSFMVDTSRSHIPALQKEMIMK